MSTIVANTLYAEPMGSKLGPFGPWLQSELNRKGWNSARLAEEMNIDRGTVNRWLRGARVPSADMCHDIAVALGVDADLVLHYAGHRQLIMGHESLDMTRRYVKLAEQDIAAAARDHSPLDSMKLSF